MSKLTRIAIRLVVTSLAIYGFILGYIRFTEPASDVFTLALKTDAPPEGEKYFEIVARYAETLSRNAGRIVVPESNLPYPREEIKRAILAQPPWAQDFQSHEGILFFSAALVELQNFVPDHSAKDITHEQIWDRQLEVINWLGRYRSAGWPKDPIPIGEVKRALDRMSSQRDAQLMGYLAVFVWFGFAILKSRTKLSLTLWRTWQFWLFVVITLFYFELGEFTALFGQWLAYTTRRDAIFETGTWLTFALGIFIPLLVVSILWDLLWEAEMRKRKAVVPEQGP
jgi:hypothetical protein